MHYRWLCSTTCTNSSNNLVAKDLQEMSLVPLASCELVGWIWLSLCYLTVQTTLFFSCFSGDAMIAINCRQDKYLSRWLHSHSPLASRYCLKLLSQTTNSFRMVRTWALPPHKTVREEEKMSEESLASWEHQQQQHQAESSSDNYNFRNNRLALIDQDQQVMFHGRPLKYFRAVSSFILLSSK